MTKTVEYVRKTDSRRRSRFFLAEARHMLSGERRVFTRLLYLTVLVPLSALGTVSAAGMLRTLIEHLSNRVLLPGSHLGNAFWLLTVLAVLLVISPLLLRFPAVARLLVSDSGRYRPVAYSKTLYTVGCFLVRTAVFCAAPAIAFFGLRFLPQFTRCTGFSETACSVVLLLLCASLLLFALYRLSALFLLPQILVSSPSLSARAAKKAAFATLRGRFFELLRFRLSFFPAMLLTLLTGGVMLFYFIPYYAAASALFADYLLHSGVRCYKHYQMIYHYRSTEVSVK